MNVDRRRVTFLFVFLCLIKRKLVLVFVVILALLFVSALLVGPVGSAPLADGGSLSDKNLCPVWDTGFVQTTATASQVFTWTLSSRPNAVAIWVCNNATGSYCVLAGGGMKAWYYGAGSTEYGLVVGDITAAGITLVYNAGGLANHVSVGWLMRGSAYVRVVAFLICEQYLTPTPISTDTPVPIHTPFPAWIITDTLSSGTVVMIDRSVSYGDVITAGVLLAAVAVVAFKAVQNETRH